MTPPIRSYRREGVRNPTEVMALRGLSGRRDAGYAFYETAIGKIEEIGLSI